MTLSAWIIRGLLAALLLFGSEILLWTNPTGRSFPDWLILATGYLALSAVLLDLAVRYRVRELFGLLALAGVYGLANSLLLNPQMALADMPRTLVTRVMGAHTLIGLLMLALFLALAGGSIGRAIFIVVGVAGLGWGVWVCWLAAFTDIVSTDVPLGTMLAYGAGGLAAIVVLRLTSPQTGLYIGDGLQDQTYSPPSERNGTSSLELRIVGWLIGVVVLAANFMMQFGTIDPLWSIIIVVLLAFCAILVRFQKREKGAMLLDNRIPFRPIASSQMVASAVVFLGAGAIGYSLPFSAEGEQLALLVGLFTAFGLVWLPTVSLVLGVRAYRKFTRQQRL